MRKATASARIAPLALLGMVAIAACGASSDSDIGEPASSIVTAVTAPPTTPAPANSSAAVPVSTTAATSSASVTPAPATSVVTVATAPAASNERQIKITVGVDSSPTRIEKVAKGALVTVVMVNPTTHDEYHLHGYDLELKADAGEAATFSFTARTAGRFEIESHSTKAALVIIEVE